MIPFEDEVVSNDDGLVEIQRGGAAGMDEDRSAVICAFFVCLCLFLFLFVGGFFVASSVWDARFSHCEWIHSEKRRLCLFFL